MTKKKKEANRTLYISHCVPPIVTGPSVLIERLLHYFPKNSYAIFTSKYQRSRLSIDKSFRLSCEYIYSHINTTESSISKFRRNIGQWLEVPIIVIDLLRSIRKLSIKRLLVSYTPSDGNFVAAACLVHRMTRIPVSFYLWDMIDQGTRRNIYERLWTPFLERLAISTATNVFVMSKFLLNHYSKKFGIDTIYLPQPVDKSRYPLSSCAYNNNNNTLNITFTGIIYESQLDAIRNLSTVVNSLSNVMFNIYTTTPFAYLSNKGIVFSGKTKYRDSIPVCNVPIVQRQADILFLPMAFHVPDPQAHRTASPSKLGEYLASGRPILAHAPAYTYVAQYVKEHKCALLVDTPNLEALKQGVLTLKNDLALRKSIVHRARQAARDHDAEKVSTVLQKALGIVS